MMSSSGHASSDPFSKRFTAGGAPEDEPSSLVVLVVSLDVDSPPVADVDASEVVDAGSPPVVALPLVAEMPDSLPVVSALPDVETEPELPSPCEESSADPSQAPARDSAMNARMGLACIAADSATHVPR
jgi:hypothetical protein